MKINSNRSLVESLRKEGRSLSEISKITGISVGTAGFYAAKVKLTEEQKEKLMLRNPAINSAINQCEKKRNLDLRIKYQQEGRELAKNKEWLFIAISNLYWGEGEKRINYVSFTNSDPFMLNVFYQGLVKYFPEEINRVKLNVHCHNTNSDLKSEEELVTYWNSTLGIPKENIYVKYIKPSKRSKLLKINKHVYGIPKLSICNVRMVQMFYGCIQEVAGFDNRKWLRNY